MDKQRLIKDGQRKLFTNYVTRLHSLFFKDKLLTVESFDDLTFPSTEYQRCIRDMLETFYSTNPVR